MPRYNLQRRLQSTKAHPKRELLPDGPARTRFAPSPTGYLHLGSLRTALFNYLLAKRTGGQFLLRLEDTDQKRTIDDAEHRLYEDLRWTGLDWDEGPEVGGSYGPYKQSERTALYEEHAQKLLSSGHAYRCFCSAERLNELAAQRAKIGLPTDYDRTCASISHENSDDRASKGEPFVVRLKSPDTYPEFRDIVYGKVGKTSIKSNRHIDYAYDDPILLKSDGLPTYHLANVVDDHHMKITHVIRGTEWMIATPKHLAMYDAFGWQPPYFAHVGLLQNEDGSKLSKRKGNVDISSFRDQGILPEALVNFVALLGWAGNTGGSEFLTMQDLEKEFNMKWTKGNATVDLGKLNFLQRQHATHTIKEGCDRFGEIADAVVDKIEETATTDLDDILRGRDVHDYAIALLRANSKNYSNPAEFVSENSYMFHAFEPSADLAKRALSGALPRTLDTLKQLRYDFENLAEQGWHDKKLHELIVKSIAHITDAHVETVMEEMAKEGTVMSADKAKETKSARLKVTKDVYQCLRGALTDGTHGAPLALVMEILGKEECMQRLRSWFALTEEGRLGLDFTVSDI